MRQAHSNAAGIRRSAINRRTVVRRYCRYADLGASRGGRPIEPCATGAAALFAAALVVERKLHFLAILSRSSDVGVQGVTLTAVLDAVGEIVRGVFEANPALSA